MSGRREVLSDPIGVDEIETRLGAVLDLVDAYPQQVHAELLDYLARQAPRWWPTQRMQGLRRRGWKRSALCAAAPVPDPAPA